MSNDWRLAAAFRSLATQHERDGHIGLAAELRNHARAYDPPKPEAETVAKREDAKRPEAGSDNAHKPAPAKVR